MLIASTQTFLLSVNYTSSDHPVVSASFIEYGVSCRNTLDRLNAHVEFVPLSVSTASETSSKDRWGFTESNTVFV